MFFEINFSVSRPGAPTTNVFVVIYVCIKAHQMFSFRKTQLKTFRRVCHEWSSMKGGFFAGARIMVAFLVLLHVFLLY